MNSLRRAFFRQAFMMMSGFIAMLLLPSSVIAGEDPIPLIDVVVEKTPPGHGQGRMQTDRNGYLWVKSLSAGTYVINDVFGNEALVKHRGGLAKWRLLGFIRNGKPVWTLVDESDPLKVDGSGADKSGAKK